MAPGRPADYDRLPADARAWADQQARDELEMLTIVDGDQSAELGDDYAVFVIRG
ncbi:hypothetical protein [Actinomadura decatromicini]|uniref:hypothetical protein n=1 Tax=Actinomadura decatromicini TaxID=2604572 RepID=UPI001652E182|nr:hypothetical protein [Actinomadura decatromicini]